MLLLMMDMAMGRIMITNLEEERRKANGWWFSFCFHDDVR